MKENLIEPERIRSIQEALCGFLLDEVINPKGDFHPEQIKDKRGSSWPKEAPQLRWRWLESLEERYRAGNPKP